MKKAIKLLRAVRISFSEKQRKAVREEARRDADLGDFIERSRRWRMGPSSNGKAPLRQELSHS